MEPDTEERRRFTRRALEHRRLLPWEDLDTFVYQLERLLDRACPRLSSDIQRRELLDRLIHGLPPSIRDAFGRFSNDADQRSSFLRILTLSQGATQQVLLL